MTTFTLRARKWGNQAVHSLAQLDEDVGWLFSECFKKNMVDYVF